MENTSYDHNAQKYKSSRDLPFRHNVEEYTFMQLCGNVSGLKILDLACGAGHYTRLLKRAGAAEALP